METKYLTVDAMKSVSDEGTFTGILSPYGNIDNGGDIVEKGAFTKTLQVKGGTVPLLWQHKSDTPIGELKLEDRADGLYAKGELLMQLPEAQKAHLLMKKGITRGLSIGFKTIRHEFDNNGVRHLKEVALYEGSVVTFPMNEQAQITSVKSLVDLDNFSSKLDEFRKELKTWKAH
jgi:HK97 family phage prohead protease